MDRQLRGPYRLWRHLHEFEAHDEGTLVRDTVDYALAFGPFGELANAAFVRRDLAGLRLSPRPIDHLGAAELLAA